MRGEVEMVTEEARSSTAKRGGEQINLARRYNGGGGRCSLERALKRDWKASAAGLGARARRAEPLRTMERAGLCSIRRPRQLQGLTPPRPSATSIARPTAPSVLADLKRWALRNFLRSLLCQLNASHRVVRISPRCLSTATASSTTGKASSCLPGYVWLRQHY